MSNQKNLFAGYAREKITPDYEISLSGYGDDAVRKSQGISDDIFLTCIAVSDNEETVLLYTSDLLSFNMPLAKQVREAVDEALGISGEKIFVSGNHSHSAPWIYGPDSASKRFCDDFIAAAVKTAKAALEDRAPADMLSTVQIIEGMNFIRHYKMNDGSYCGSNFGNWSSGIVGHAAETDPRMILIKFKRDEKSDIVMMNWQAHNDDVSQIGYNLISASYVGQIRKNFEADTGMNFAFFMGASGNQNKDSKIKKESHGLNWMEYGRKMADYAIAAMDSLKPVTGSGIKTKRVIFEAEIDHSWEHMLDKANEVIELRSKKGRTEADELARSFGFSSAFQANFIRLRSGMPATTKLELNAFSIGDMGFITGPNEMFSTTGIFVRANAPFETVFIISGNALYLPCSEAYDYRSYEADTAMYAKGTEEKVSAQFVKMLEEIK